tara:strand:+ start:1085 stop:2131 length:1047 start_codon:yes stop_codon:yes gene_type:complete
MIETSCSDKQLSKSIVLKGYDTITEKIVKKRGRKPKIKKEGEVEVKKVLKKRGRKPKKICKTEEDFNKKPQKRGRKPKNKIIEKNIKKNINKSLIVHLPIKSSDIYNTDFPKPYESSGIYDYSIYMSNNKNKIKKNINENNVLCKKIINNDIDKNKLYNISYSFSQNKKWPDKVLTLCPWCCHRFDNIPISLPYSYISNVFNVSNFFCSYNCAASYNFNMDDSKIWERYSLLNLFYKKINNCKFIKIPLAPDKIILKAFGGYMDIDTYRRNLSFQKKSIDIVKQPIISIISKVEETECNINDDNFKTKFIPIDDDLIQNAEESLRIKRKNSVINKSNTLKSYMGLRIT